MHQRLPAVLLSALTGVGGHFLNQRWDRALFFFALFGLLIFLSFAIPLLSSYLGLRGLWVFVAYVACVLGIGLAWLTSMAVTWRDSSPQRLAPPLRWTFSARLGATLASLLAAGILVYALFQSSMSLFAAKSFLSAYLSAGSAVRVYDHTPPRQGKRFWQYLSLGGLSSPPDSLPAPPAGVGTLLGKFIYDGKPAAGVTLNLSLNGKYRASGLSTDAQGRFMLKLAPGDWYINHVQTESWDERPDDGEFMLLSGTEGRLRGNDYDRHGRGEGLKVTVGETPPADPLTISIRRRIAMQWPGKNDERVEAAYMTATIRWQAYPEATDYVVRIAHVERAGRSTSYSPIVSRRVRAKTELALAEVQAVPGTASSKEYQVTVAAFAADGSFLSETESYPNGQSFTLTDVQALVDDRLASAGLNVGEMMQNRKRLDAVQVLIEAGLLAEAEKILATVRGATENGNKEALTGYLRARQGRCVEAAKLFDQATAAAGKTCVPESWRTCARR